jgi:hypothetical protein
LPTCRVPAEIVVPIIKRYLDQYETDSWRFRRWGSSGNIGKLSPACILAREAGIYPDTVTKYLKGRTKYINFYIVDRMLCAMGQTERWYEWPLLPFYLAADLTVEPPPFREDVAA